ncbi:MAG: CRTAC1 family protein [Bacteroidota bacterium]
MNTGRLWGLVLLGVSLGLAGCQATSDEPGSGGPGVLDVPETLPAETRRMAEELHAIYAAAWAEPDPYFHLNARRADVWRTRVDSLTGGDELTARYNLAIELLNAGLTEQALQELGLVIGTVGADPRRMRVANIPLFELQAMAYLRLGEQRNCIEQHAPEACILPFRGAAIHADPEPSRQAIALLERLALRQRTNLQLRWLLNIAYLTVDGYPDEVPSRFLIPGLDPPPRPDVPRFPNRAVDLGVDVNALSGGVSVEDFNGDGHLDLFMTSYGLYDPVRFFLADGEGGYVDHTEAAGLTGIVSGLNTVHADYDNDGHPDVLILRGAWLGPEGAHPNSLLRNNGDGTFTDVTFSSGLISYHPTQTAAWADYNRDGHLDLFIGNESPNEWGNIYGGAGREGGGPMRHPSELFHNNGDGTFTEVAAQVGLDVTAFVKGVTWGEVDGDGRPDLYISVMGGPNLLFLNRGGTGPEDWRFEEVAAEAGVQEPVFSFPTWFWDVDHDGDDDLFVAAYDLRQITSTPLNVAREYMGFDTSTDKPRLYRNDGDGTFTNITEDAGLRKVAYAMGSNYGDLDHDGWFDVYLGTGAPDLRAIIPNRMFRGGPEGFEEITFAGGFGHIQKGHGVAFADLDRDGDQDVYSVMGGAVEGDVFQNVLFENPGYGAEHAWVKLVLEGQVANRSAVGARLALTTRHPDGQARTWYHTVGTGGSFGATSLQQEIGLGDAEALEEIRVTWPNADQTVQVIEGVPLRGVYRLVEGTAPVRLDRPATPFRTGGGHHHGAMGHGAGS